MKTKWAFSLLLIVFLMAACSSNAIPTLIPTEIPADTDGDGMFSKEEMKVTFETMHDLADQLAAMRHEIAAKINAEVSKYDETLANDPFNLELGAVQQTASELLTAIQEVNAELVK